MKPTEPSGPGVALGGPARAPRACPSPAGLAINTPIATHRSIVQVLNSGDAARLDSSNETLQALPNCRTAPRWRHRRRVERLQRGFAREVHSARQLVARHDHRAHVDLRTD